MHRLLLIMVRALAPKDSASGFRKLSILSSSLPCSTNFIVWYSVVCASQLSQMPVMVKG